MENNHEHEVIAYFLYIFWLLYEGLTVPETGKIFPWLRSKANNK